MASSTSTPQQPLTSFTCFGSLPPELRAMIWNHSFHPRALEFHPVLTNHTGSEDPDGDAERPPWHADFWLWNENPSEAITWQSHCANHPALFTCAESREEALRYFSVRLPTARVTAAGPTAEGFQAYDYKWRPLYLNPESDAIMTFGPVHQAQVLALLADIQQRDPRGRRPQRVALDELNWLMQVEMGILDKQYTATDKDSPLPFPGLDGLLKLLKVLLSQLDQLAARGYDDADADAGPPASSSRFWTGKCEIEGNGDANLHWDSFWVMLFEDVRQCKEVEEDAIVINGIKLQMRKVEFVKMGGGDRRVTTGMKDVEDMDEREEEGKAEGPSDLPQLTRRKRNLSEVTAAEDEMAKEKAQEE